VPRVRKVGIKMPIRMLAAGRKAAIPPSLAASVLMQETSGGANIFGHDKTIFAGAGTVTRAKYQAYKKQRGPDGTGGMQGAAPCSSPSSRSKMKPTPAAAVGGRT
jgi:hypothetical protein